ncbi:MAG: 4-alpha-glucanotransferase [Acidobacteriota bacterium]
MNIRGSGILLHLTSLPSPYGIGDFGPEALRFVDFLKESGQSYWQILPLTPTDPAYDSSPYHSLSTLAINPLLLSPEILIQEGLLTETEAAPWSNTSVQKIDYEGVISYKQSLFLSSWERFKKKKDQGFDTFCQANSDWLDDYALFSSIKSHFNGKTWSSWPTGIKNRISKDLETLRNELRDQVEMIKFLQYKSFQQWQNLHHYCYQKGIHIIGDMPIYVDYDSVDVWANPELFKLNENKRPYVIAGVPPDYFSQTGQLWGNPIYNWERLREQRYQWWIQRMEQNLKLYDIIRIDHFRGFVGYWEVPATERTAINGKWVEAPAVDFFTCLNRRFLNLPIIAEDLGTITPDVREVIDKFGFPGMKILLFAFGEDNPLHPYLPHVYEKNFVVYTGTHDNNTAKGWFGTEASQEEKRRLFAYVGKELQPDEVPWALIRLGMMSVANTFIVPLQDILGLGEDARMNRPASAKGNWRWRMLPEQLNPSLAQQLAELTLTYGRNRGIH